MKSCTNTHKHVLVVPVERVWENAVRSSRSSRLPLLVKVMLNVTSCVVLRG